MRTSLPPADITKCVVSVLLRGLTGMGVGRAEAAELARRFDVALASWSTPAGVAPGLRAVKNHGEWFVAARTQAENRCWSVGQVAEFLYGRERNLSSAAPPAPGFVLRVEESGDPADPFLTVESAS